MLRSARWGAYCMSGKRGAGFSLVELMITLVVLAILAAVAFPNFQGVMRSSRVATTTNELLASLSLARAEAIKNAHGAGVCASTAGAACDGASWGDGWMVWGDINANGAFDAGEAVVRVSPGNPKVVAGNANLVIAFDSRGRRRSQAAQAIALRPDDCGGQALLRTVSINQTGQTKVAKGACP